MLILVVLKSIVAGSFTQVHRIIFVITKICSQNLNHLTILDDLMSVTVKPVLFPITGKGEVKLRFGQRVFTLTSVMYADQLRQNIISGHQLDLNG